MFLQKMMIFCKNIEIIIVYVLPALESNVLNFGPNKYFLNQSMLLLALGRVLKCP